MPQRDLASRTMEEMVVMIVWDSYRSFSVWSWEQGFLKHMAALTVWGPSRSRLVSHYGSEFQSSCLTGRLGDGPAKGDAILHSS